MAPRKSNNILKLLAFTVCLNSGPAVVGGGGHTIRNGGDLAELELARIWSTLDQEIAPCGQASNPCGLEAEELKAVALLLEAFPKRGTFDFMTSSQAISYQTQERFGSPILFNRLALYDGPVAKAYDQLAAIVIESLFDQLGVGSKLLAEKISASWLAQARSISTIVDDSNLILQWVNLKDRHVKVFLDLPAESHDITELLTSKSPCGTKLQQTNFSSARFEMLSPQQFLLMGEVEWRCEGGSRYSATVRIKGAVWKKQGQSQLDRQGLSSSFIYVKAVE